MRHRWHSGLESPSRPISSDALRRLEYRGYDSAGIATVEDGHLDRRRAGGQVAQSREPALSRAAAGPYRHRPHALGHARPADRAQCASAHVGQSLGRAQRHHRELSASSRAELSKRGHKFETDTDTEAVVHLITDELQKGLAPVEAVKAALGKLRARFALGIIFAGQDDLIDRGASGSPLAIGHGRGEMYLGSDAIALALIHGRHH